MCIAIVNPSNKTLSKETLENCWLNNDDGAGLMYNQDGKLKVYKQLENFDKFYNKYMKIKETCPDSLIVLHFRISTHGVINKTNCHPFLVNQNLGFVHNGQLFNVEEANEYSDTYMFNKNILKGFPRGTMSIKFLKTKAMQLLISDFITDRNKLAFMDNENNYVIFNEEEGLWDDGVWYSNTSYQRVKNYVDYGGTKVYRGNRGSSIDSSFSSQWDWRKDYDYYGGSGIGYGSGSTYGTAKQEPISEDEFEENYDVKHRYADDLDENCYVCGNMLWKGELVSKGGRCMDCMPKGMQDKLLSSAYGDIKQEDVSSKEIDVDSYTFDFDEIEELKEEEKMCTCDYCFDTVKSDELHNVPEWNANICISCVDEFETHGYLEIIDRDIARKLDALRAARIEEEE